MKDDFLVHRGLRCLKDAAEKTAKSLRYKRHHWEQGSRSWSALKIKWGRSHPCLLWMQEFTPLRKERPWDFNSFWGVLSLSYLDKWLWPHDLQHSQPHDKGLWNNFFHFLQAGWNMAWTMVESTLEVPDWDLALTLSSCSGVLTSPALHFLHLFPGRVYLQISKALRYSLYPRTGI